MVIMLMSKPIFHVHAPQYCADNWGIVGICRYHMHYVYIIHNCQTIISVVLSLRGTHKIVVLPLECKAVIALPEITQNYGNYPYGNYVGNALVGKVISLP